MCRGTRTRGVVEVVDDEPRDAELSTMGLREVELSTTSLREAELSTTSLREAE
jgi:hypothetical protein